MNKIERFNELIKSGDYVVLDTETTGLTDGEICQIAIINSDGSCWLNTLVKTTRPIPADAARIHGITDEMVADAPGWELIAPRVKEYLTGKNIVVYNAKYDRMMMYQSGEKCGIERIAWSDIATFHCAMETYAEFWGGTYGRWQKLTNAISQQKINIEATAHDALGDCLMTLALVKKMAGV